MTPLCLEGHHSGVNALAISRDWLFTASTDQTIRVWDITTYALVAILDLHHTAAVLGLAVGGGHYGTHLYSCSEDGTVKSFNISDEAMKSGETLKCVVLSSKPQTLDACPPATNPPPIPQTSGACMRAAATQPLTLNPKPKPQVRTHVSTPQCPRAMRSYAFLGASQPPRCETKGLEGLLWRGRQDGACV